MDFHLTVMQDFGDHRRGDHIEDAAEVARILAGEHQAHVIKVPADRKPAAVPAPAAEASVAADAALDKKPAKAGA